MHTEHLKISWLSLLINKISIQAALGNSPLNDNFADFVVKDVKFVRNI